MKKTHTTTILILIFVIMIVPFVSSKVFAQQLKIGDHVQENIKVRIDENGTAHVVHMVQGNSNSPVNVETIRGNMTNVSVTDLLNNTIQYETIL